MDRRGGYTIVELLVTLTVGATLISLALPGFQSLIASERSTAALNQMVGAVNFARAQAIVSGHVVTLCPAAGGVCLGHHQWHHGAMVFIDHNADGNRDGQDRVIRAFPALAQGGRIYWRSFRNRSYLQFQPRGYTQWQNGSFLYCPPDNDPMRAGMIIVNTAGRTRPARDFDDDGVAEDAGGNPLDCT